MGERRRSLRRKHFLRGRVYFDEGRDALHCLICDLSDEGAHIILSEKVNFPDVLKLYIPRKEKTQRARVQWRHGNEIGLVFIDARCSGRPESAEESAVRRSQFEAETSLRRVLQRLKARLFPISHQP